jgi:hypothetical protein
MIRHGVSQNGKEKSTDSQEIGAIHNALAVGRSKKDVPACGSDSYLKLSVPTGRLTEIHRMEDFVTV